MGKFVIKKKVSLDFLGDDYKDSHIILRSISVKEYDVYSDQAKSLEEGDDKKSVRLIVDQLKSHFIEGKVQGEDLKAEDLEELDVLGVIEIFKQFTGQVDPKV